MPNVLLPISLGEMLQYVEEHRLNESIFQAAIYLLTLSVKYITSEYFTRQLDVSDYGWNQLKTIHSNDKYSLRFPYIGYVKCDQKVTPTLILSMFAAESP